MSIGYKDDKGKFHPINTTKGTRKSRDQKAKTQGVKVKERKQKQVMAPQITGMSMAKKKEWEDAVGSEVVKVKKEMMNGRPVTSVRFANGEEWFEFDEVKHQEEFMKKEKIEVDESIVGEFVEVDHPDLAGYITMATGKVLFGEREDRMKKDETNFRKADTKTALEFIKAHPNATRDNLTESTDIGGIDNEDSDLEAQAILNTLEEEGKITSDNPDAEFVEYRLTKKGEK